MLEIGTHFPRDLRGQKVHRRRHGPKSGIRTSSHDAAGFTSISGRKVNPAIRWGSASSTISAICIFASAGFPGFSECATTASLSGVGPGSTRSIASGASCAPSFPKRTTISASGSCDVKSGSEVRRDVHLVRRLRERREHPGELVPRGGIRDARRKAQRGGPASMGEEATGALAEGAGVTGAWAGFAASPHPTSAIHEVRENRITRGERRDVRGGRDVIEKCACSG